MLILGIESSCDDTSVALLDCSDQGCFVIRDFTASQIEIHKKYGGVVPEIAGRMHAEKITPLIEEILKNQPRPDVIAATSGPGLVTGLLVGVEAARTLSYAWNIPLVSVNHIEGHIYATEINESHEEQRAQITYPALALIVSGGHTEIILIESQGQYKKIGATLDDAAGECFDKVAKLLGLPYPGGPKISILAQTGKTDAIEFPRPMLKDNNYNFSFSGLKTATLYWLQKNKLSAAHITPYELPAGIFGQTAEAPTVADFCASLEQAIVDVLVEKTTRAAKEFNPKTIILAGGVAANKKLRETLATTVHSKFPDTQFLTPSTKYCMDNAAMIAVAGYYNAINKNYASWGEISANPNWELA